MEFAVHAQHFQICLRVARKAEYYGAVHGFKIHRCSVEHFVQFQAQVSVGSLRAEAAGAVQDLDVAVDRTQIATAVNATDQHAAIHGSDASEQHTIGNVDVILDGDFNTLTFWISSVNGDLARHAIDIDLDTLQILAVRVSGLHRFNFYFVAIPAFYLHGAIHVFEQKTSARRQWIAVFEGLTIGNRTEAGRREKYDANEQQQ